jgi:uncharacterized damage-inducible protein DinB
MSEQRTRETKIVQPLDGCDPLIGAALWGIEDARQRTREALRDLKPQTVDWQPAQGAHTIGTLLYHIAAIELDWLHSEVREGRSPDSIWDWFPHEVRDEAGMLTIVKGEPLEKHWQRLDAVRALLLDTFKSMTLAEYRRVRTFERYDVTPEWVLHHLMQHEAEHRDEIRSLCQRALY